MPKTPRPDRITRADTAAPVRKGVQFDIDPVLWLKFKELAIRENTSVSELMVELVEGFCSQNYSRSDAASGRTYPGLIGSAKPGIEQ